MFLLIWKKQIMPCMLSYFPCYEVPSAHSSVPHYPGVAGQKVGKEHCILSLPTCLVHSHLSSGPELFLFLQLLQSQWAKDHKNYFIKRKKKHPMFTQGFIRTFPWMAIFQAYYLMPPVPLSASPFSSLFPLFSRQFCICFHIISPENDLPF